MTKKRIFMCVLSTIITGLIIYFILHNSSESAADSTERSGNVLLFVQGIIDKLGIGIELTDHLIRKIAHFTEFAILGVSVYLTYFLYKLRIKLVPVFTLVTGLLIAVIDEVSQLFSLGRSCQIKDVIIDFSGVLFATAIITIIFYVVIKKKKGNNKNGEDN